MPSLDAEIRHVQNPAFGAAILAAFLQGFYDADQSKKGVPLPYLFLVLPIVLHADMFRLLSNTKAGLRQMAEKFVSTEYAGTALLLSLNTRALLFRRLTSDSIGILLLTGLAHLDSRTARIVPRKVVQFSERPDVPDEADESRKLGRWFSELSTFEIGSILKVTF